VQLFVIELVETCASENDGVYTTQLLLVLAKRLTQYTLDSISLYRQTYVFFGDD